MTDIITLPLIIRALGRGKKGTRDLTYTESHFAMQAILQGTITGPQLGALLMLMRVKEETSEEIAGMVSACDEYLNYQPKRPIDINWPAYAGKKKQPSWYLLAANLLAQNGYRILLHGGGEHTPGRQYARAVCTAIGIPVCRSLSEAEAAIEQQQIAYLSLADFLPTLSELIDMKAELGLRSPINTLVRHLNPLRAATTLQGMFHPSYMPLHHDSATRLKQTNNIVVKGDGGEFEIRPDSDTRIATNAHSANNSEQLYPPVLKQRAIRPASVSLEPLLALWQGDMIDSYGEAAVIETATLIVTQHEKISIESARTKVQDWWAKRVAVL